VKYIINRSRYEDKLADVVTDELEILVTGQMPDVIRGTCNQVVYGNNSESLGDEAIAQMESEKSGSPVTTAIFLEEANSNIPFQKI
jgi:hypothetical protein